MSILDMLNERIDGGNSEMEFAELDVAAESIDTFVMFHLVMDILGFFHLIQTSLTGCSITEEVQVDNEKQCGICKYELHDESERRIKMAKNSLQQYTHYHERWDTNQSLAKRSEKQCQLETYLKFILEAWLQSAVRKTSYKANLIQRGVSIGSALCLLCNAWEVSEEHIFLKCSYVKELMAGLSNWWSALHNVSGWSYADIRNPDIRNFRKLNIAIRIRIRNFGYPEIRISEISDSYSDSNNQIRKFKPTYKSEEPKV
ncbi:hypothetical protein LXL04_030350 [Taraxacum kok-saghyz]